MANEIKYNRLYITDIYNKFKNNVVNVISELSSSDENLKVYSDNSTKYIYANQSSPLTNGELANSTTSKISFNVNSTSYNFYTKHSYTYTENVIGNNFKAFIIAYDYVKGTHGVFENITVLPSLTHQPNGTTNKVNVFSKTSYIVTSPNINGYPDEGTNMSSTTSISLNANNFNELLGSNDYVDCKTFVKFSYITQNPRDGEIHNDGKNRLSETELRDFHIWSFTDGYDTTSHLYTENDNAYVNAYAYFNFGTNLNNYFTKNNTNLASVKDYIDTNYVDVVNQQNNNTLFIPNWTVKKSSNKVYIADVKSTTNEKHGQRFKEFYNNAKAYNLPGHVGESFVNVKKYPSWRNNISTCLFYEKIKGDSNGTSGQQSHLGINNYNSAKFIKKISGLPVHIVDNKITIYLYSNFYYTNENDVYDIRNMYNQSESLECGGEWLLSLDFNDSRYNSCFKIKFAATLTFASPGHSVYDNTTSDILQFHCTEISATTDNQHPTTLITINNDNDGTALASNKLVFNVDWWDNENVNNSHFPLNMMAIKISDTLGKDTDLASRYSHIGFNDDDETININGISVNKYFGRIYCNNEPQSLTYTDYFEDNNNKIKFYYLDADANQECSTEHQVIAPQKLNTSDNLSNTTWGLHELHIYPPLTFIYGNGGVATGGSGGSGGSGGGSDYTPPTLTSNNGTFNYRVKFMGSGSGEPGSIGGTYIKIEDSPYPIISFKFNSQARIRIKTIYVGGQVGHYTTLGYGIYKSLSEANQEAGDITETGDYSTTNGMVCNGSGEQNTTYYLRLSGFSNKKIFWSQNEYETSDFISDINVNIAVYYELYNTQSNSWTSEMSLGIFEGECLGEFSN